MSFASEPGHDDGSLPPLNIEIPDDARELARDVLAYHREQRARRRRERILRLLGPLSRAGFIRHGTIFPLIATCVAMSMLIGAMLSVMTISPAYAPTRQASPPPAHLPAGTVQIDNASVPLSSLTDSVLVLIPPKCGCGTTLEALAEQSKVTHDPIYFVYHPSTSATLAQMEGLTTQYGEGAASTVADTSGLLFHAFGLYSLTALLVHPDGTVDVHRSFPTGFDLTPALQGLRDTH